MKLLHYYVLHTGLKRGMLANPSVADTNVFFLYKKLLEAAHFEQGVA